MKNMRNIRKNEEAVSPVIGVILMVVIIVIIAAIDEVISNITKSDSTKVAVWIFVILVALYLVIQEVRYQECVSGIMQSPYAIEAYARYICK